MSSDNKEPASEEKKKKSRPRLSIKIFSGKKKDSLQQIQEGGPGETATVTATATEEGAPRGDDNSSSSDSDIGDNSIPKFRPNRRRSLSACADFLDERIAVKVGGAASAGSDEGDGGGQPGKKKEEEEEEEEEGAGGDDQLSPLPCSPTRSCLRQRAATISYDGEVVVVPARAHDDSGITRPRTVSFSPDTVDPPPRNMKYRAWIEARTRMPTVNVKHEKHKQKMNQMKKVNMSDFLISRKHPSAGLLGSSSSPFGGGGMMMM